RAEVDHLAQPELGAQAGDVVGTEGLQVVAAQDAAGKRAAAVGGRQPAEIAHVGHPVEPHPAVGACRSHPCDGTASPRSVVHTSSSLARRTAPRAANPRWAAAYSALPSGVSIATGA